MSIKLMQLVWDTSLPHTRKLVLLSLADQANDQGECYPSIATVAARCTLSRRGIFDALNALESEGYLERQQLPGQRVLFVLSLQRLKQLELPDQCTTRTGAPDAPVRQMHRCKSRTGAGAAPPGAPDAPTGARGAPAIKATQTNRHVTEEQGGTRARADDPELSGNDHERQLAREDAFNRLDGFDQDLIEPYMPRLPLGIRLDTFVAYVKHFRVKRGALSISSWQQLCDQLRTLDKDGHDLDAALRFTMRMGWTDPTPERPAGGVRSTAGPPRARANDALPTAGYEGTPDDQLPAELRTAGCANA